MPRHVLVFDSGIGGFGVVRSLRQALPGNTTIDYLADTALYPYGEQPDGPLVERIVTLIGDAVATLRPELVVIACNTASTLALDALRARLDIPFVGCVPPIRWAARLSQTRTIGLLATKATVRRPYLADLAARFAPDCTLVAYGARGLADLAERAFRGYEVPQDAINNEVAGLFAQEHGAQIDVIGIGCTHYTFLLDHLRSATSQSITWLDPADAVARQTALVLSRLVAPKEGETSTGRAFFTAPPEDQGALEARLSPFGYDRVTLFSDQRARLTV